MPTAEDTDKLADALAERLLPRLAEALDTRPMFSPQTAAEFLEMSRSKVYELIRAGKLRAVQIDGQQRIERSEMARFIAERRDGGDG